jgi:imidazolonepropionase-like amidohydrolase
VVTLDPADCVITGVFVWDGKTGARSPEPWSIRIREGRIEALGPEPELAVASPGSRVFHYGEAFEQVTAVPGLIDSHVHLTLDPFIGSPAKQFEVSPDAAWNAMCARAGAMVRAGITTARDLGAGAWHEVRLRDEIAAGTVTGPRLLCVGQPITAPGGHCHFWGGEARGSADVSRVVKRQLDHGVDWIKVMATGGVFTKGTDVTAAQYDQAELAEIVHLAAAGDRFVAAHCHGKLGIQNAASGGVRTIEHCSFAGTNGFGTDFDERVAAELVSDGIWVSPTVNAGWGRRLEKDGAPTPFFERMSKCLSHLREAGAKFIASTDAGIPGVEHHRLAQGLEAFARYAGASPVETLRSATSESARALGLENETGVLSAGLSADLLLVAGNPLEDLGVLRRPVLVVARGRPVS